MTYTEDNYFPDAAKVGDRFYHLNTGKMFIFLNGWKEVIGLNREPKPPDLEAEAWD